MVLFCGVVNVETMNKVTGCIFCWILFTKIVEENNIFVI